MVQDLPCPALALALVGLPVCLPCALLRCPGAAFLPHALCPALSVLCKTHRPTPPQFREEALPCPCPAALPCALPVVWKEELAVSA